MKIRIGSDDLVELVAPIDEGITPAAALLTATVSAVLLNTAADTVLDAAEAAGQTVLSVESARRIAVGDVVRIEQDDATTLEATVSAVDGSAGTLTLGTALASAARKGAGVAVKIGPTVPLAGFNLSAANVETTDWGYRGEIEHNHAGLIAGQVLRVEISTVQGGRVDRRGFLADVLGPSGA